MSSLGPDGRWPPIDWKLLATSRIADVGGIRFDFNPPSWPAADAPWEWVPEPIEDWLDAIGLEWPVPTAGGAAGHGIYCGCMVYAYDSQPCRYEPQSVLEDTLAADEVRLSLRLREPDGCERDLSIPFTFYRNAGAYLGLSAIDERIARAIQGDEHEAPRQSGQQHWHEAFARREELDAALNDMLDRVRALERRGQSDDIPRRKTYSADQLALMGIIELAARLGYVVRSAEFAAYERPAKAGLASKTGGAKGGRNGAATRAEKTARWRSEALPLVRLAVAKRHIRSISKAAEDVVGSWKGQENDTPSVAWARDYITELIASGEVELQQ